MQLRFHVQGSAAEPYVVTVVQSPTGVVASCTCAAADSGTHCKHRVEILLGTSKAIVSGNREDMMLAAGWLPGTPLAAALDEVVAAEANLAAAKTRVAQSKRRLSAVLSM